MVKKLLLVAVVLGLLIPAMACSSGAPSSETVKIGCLLDTTGDLGPMGGRILNGARLAVDEINAAGGVLGKQVELVEEDGKTDPGAGFDRVKKMVEIDGVQVITGPMITGASLLAIPYVKGRQVPLISPSATGIQLSNEDGTEWFFRTCLRDDAQGMVLADLIAEKGYTKLATIVLDNTYGKGLEQAIVDELEVKGWSGEQVASIHYAEGTKDYRSELQKIKDAGADVVVCVSYCDDGIIIFKQALDLGLDEVAWMGCDGNYGSGLFKDAKSAEFMEKAFVAGTRTVGTGPQNDHFVAAYTEKYGEAPEVYCDTMYDAVWAAAKAIQAAGTYDGDAIRVALTGIQFDGATGPITFNDIGDRSSGAFEIWEVVLDPSTETGYKNAPVKVITWST
ncbi:MAG: ABC transporter substrate-binding protein [Dehalococcoidia bacterium]|nr:ABC transporter substrate-binding protein [Dehalococcoidia bacterium]